MKKFTIFLVAVLTVATLAGCGSTKQTADNTIVMNETSTTQSQTVELKDTTSGVAINGKVGTGTQIEAKTISSGTDYDKTKEYVDTLGDDIAFNVYDISLLDKDKAKVQPDGTVEVKIKLSDKMKNAAGDAYIVFHSQGEDFTRIACVENDGYVTFKTTHFSIYTVVKYDSKDETTVEKIEEVTEAPTKPETESKTEANTELTSEDTNKDSDEGSDEAGKAALKSDNVEDHITVLNKTMYATSTVNVRSGPNSEYTKLGTLSSGDSVSVTGQYQENEWYQISYNGSTGYVSNLYLSDNKPSENTASNSQPSNETTSNNDNKPAETPITPESQPTQPIQPTETPTTPEPTQPTVVMCPYETLKWTYYEGHFGFFSGAHDDMRTSANMSAALYTTGPVPSIEVGCYYDKGFVYFEYNDELNEDTVKMPY